MRVPSLSLAAIELGRPGALQAVGAGALLVTILVLWAYRKVPMAPGQRLLAVAAKLCGLYLLLACWLEPQWLTRVPRERANSVAILFDDSRSMALPSAPGKESRGERMLEAWHAGSTGWRADLERDFRVRTFSFAGALRDMGPSSSLVFKDSPTILLGALQQARERMMDKPAGMVVFTDGVSRDLLDGEYGRLPPVYPVIVGESLQIPDLSLGAVSTTQSAFEDAPVTLQAEVRCLGIGARPALLRVRVEPLEGTDPPPRSGGTSLPLGETRVEVRPEQGRAMAQIQFEPTRSGPTFYRVSVDSEQVAPGSELTLENNTRIVCVNRAGGPHKILYVAGRPNWEFGPIRRALDGDAELQLRALIRVAKREPKFTFKGRGGDVANPLFRGFQNGEDAEVQRYDKPVVVRVNVDSPEELAGGFPKTAEELFTFKGIILANLEAEFFAPEQLRLLQRFVAERGGGLLMLGGMESFEGGGWRGTPVEAALPVWLGKEGVQEPGTFQWKLTREGLIEPWVRRRKSESEEVRRTEDLPPLAVLNHVQGIKPAASVLALATGTAEARPALVMQRFGLGRSGALLAGDLFRWGLGQPGHAADLAKFWRQVSRWLVSDTPNAVELSVQGGGASRSSKLLVRVRDAQARAVEDAEVEIRVKRAGDASQAGVILRAEAAPEPGVYVSEYPAGINGALVGEAVARSVDGSLVGNSTVGWVQDSLEGELDAARPDRQALLELARKTGGALLELTELDGLVSRLRAVPDMATEVRVRPLWHTGGVLALALAFFALEWILRRRSGAA